MAQNTTQIETDDRPIGTNYGKGTEPVGDGKYNKFDRVVYWVGNAKMTAFWFCTSMGFDLKYYKGLENGSKDTAHYVIVQDRIHFEFVSAYMPNDETHGPHLVKHGDAVKDIGFNVENVEACVKEAEERGAKIVKQPWKESDQDGTVTYAIVQTFGDTTHTLIDRTDYNGAYLPGYGKPRYIPPALLERTTKVGLEFVDHCVGNQPDLKMEDTAEWYQNNLQFHRYWSVDDTQMCTEFSALRSVVMASWNEQIKMPINEPAPGKRKSQIEEYVVFNGGAGIQHIALHTSDILHAIETLKKSGTEFLTPPTTYYANLRQRLAKSKCKVVESLDEIERLKILVDYDDNGYLLQLFTKPLQDRPTFFMEIIQRRNHQGFGAGNFKALFQAIEEDQWERGFK